MDFAFLAAYLALPVIAYVRTRNLTWLVINLAAAISVAGVIVGLARDRGYSWTMPGLQLVLLISLLVVAVLAFVTKVDRPSPVRRQLLAILVPSAVVLAVVLVITIFLTNEPAFYHPVSYLIGHSVAEDNAKWLDFTSQLASGHPIVQAVPMGGPLQLIVVFVATVMAVVSTVLFGGVNQVAVAANSVIYAEYLMVALMPLALAPLVDARIRRPSDAAGRRGFRIPWPVIWVAAIVLGSACLVVTEYGHLTLQFVFLVAALWSTTFLSDVHVRRGRFLTSLVIAAAMTVWLPLNVLAVVVLGGLLVILVRRPIRNGIRSIDVVGAVLWLIVTVAVWEPIQSSLAYLLGTPTAAGPVDGGSGAAKAISAAAGAFTAVPTFAVKMLGLDEASLFSSTGGTEQAGPILILMALVSLVMAVIVIGRQTKRDIDTYLRFAPIGLLVFFSIAITMMDLWTTGAGPHYGSVKFGFMTVVVVLATTVPFALMELDRDRTGMTPLRFAGLGAVIFLLVLDTILPRSIAALRPAQWSPAIPFNNPASYWWPADVKKTANQTIDANPVACVYLPPGAKVPSALMVSQLSDAQRVYSCTRLIAGLAGSDTTAQPLVDWLRREWLTNTPAWAEVYDGLAGMPESVLNKPVILLDEGSNVVGLEKVKTLLERYPKYAGKTPEEMAVINGTASQ